MTKFKMGDLVRVARRGVMKDQGASDDWALRAGFHIGQEMRVSQVYENGWFNVAETFYNLPPGSFELVDRDDESDFSKCREETHATESTRPGTVSAVGDVGMPTFPVGRNAPALPIDAKARKGVPIYSGFFKYFPRAIAAVAELSRKGNEQHNPGKPLHWDRSKSGDELDALSRHLIDEAMGTEVDSDGVLHAVKVAWRAMAQLEKKLEILSDGRIPIGALSPSELPVNVRSGTAVKEPYKPK